MKETWRNIKAYIKKNKWSCIVYLGIVFLVYSTLFSYVSNKNAPDIKEITYNEFLEYLDNGDVDTVYYNASDEYMTITLYNSVSRELSEEDLKHYDYPAEDKRICLYPAHSDFRKDVLEAGAKVRLVSHVSILNIISTLISSAISIFFIVFIMTMLKSQMKGLDERDIVQNLDDMQKDEPAEDSKEALENKDKKKSELTKKTGITFEDIIGHDEIIDDVRFITELIKNPDIGKKIGAKMPKGILFEGPPGTGKTLLAKAIANEAGVPFLYQNASGFIEMYVGLGARRVRELFKIARKHAPCILFIDEIDALGGKRGETRGTQENEQTINALLQEMDGFSGREGIFIIAATNRADALDDALVRSGRFDRQIQVNPPKDWKVRKKLFEHYLAKFAVSDDVDIDNLSKQVAGFTGADIAMICNEASIIAVMKKKAYIDNDCLEEAIDKKVFKGNRAKDGSTNKSDKKVVAYHEAGHAVMSYLVGEPIARASILATISGVGGAVFNEDKDTVFQTDSDFRNRVLIAYAGRISEEIKFEHVTTGASNDITQATNIMMQYVERFGFDKDFGLLDISVLSKQHLIDSDKITEKLSQMSTELYAKGKKLLSDHYDKVEKLAQKLLEFETLTGDEINVIMESPVVMDTTTV